MRTLTAIRMPVGGHDARRRVRDEVSILRTARRLRRGSCALKLMGRECGSSRNARLDPAGLIPLCCSLTPHGFISPAGIMFPGR